MIHYLLAKDTKNLLVLKKILFGAALIWTGIISYLCLIQSNNLPKISFPNLDKIIHVFFHFVFTILWFLFFKIHLKKYSKKKIFMISFLLSFCFGVTIEILQSLLTTTRSGDVIDVLANTTGAILAFFMISVLDKNKLFCKI